MMPFCESINWTVEKSAIFFGSFSAWPFRSLMFSLHLASINTVFIVFLEEGRVYKAFPAFAG
jgi:hypothetical protein